MVVRVTAPIGARREDGGRCAVTDTGPGRRPTLLLLSEITFKAPVASLHHCNYQLSGSKCSVISVLAGSGLCKLAESSRSGEAETTPTLKKGELYE